MRVLVLGVSGMLGHAMFSVLGECEGVEVFGASRSAARIQGAATRLRSGFDVLNADDLMRAVRWARPDVIVNAVGVVKQLDAAKDPLQTIPINSILPHRLAALCATIDARLVHVSTDCVFTGEKGDYKEADRADALDLYGLSKYLGEVGDQPHAITLRTSIIGRELGSATGLVEWFLNSKGAVNGFTNAIFSGFPTVALADIVARYVLPNPALSGLYHVSAEPIDKYSLLKLLAQVYGLEKDINPVSEPRIDRSLNSDRFRAETGFAPPDWPTLLRQMKSLQH